MESLTRDIDERVAVTERDLARGYQFLRIAEASRAAGRDDDALEWAKRGVAAFGDSPDRRLVDFLADEHARRGDHAGEIERKTNDAYGRAVEHAREVRTLLSELGRGDEFPIYVADLRARHQRKRNLVKLLDAL